MTALTAALLAVVVLGLFEGSAADADRLEAATPGELLRWEPMQAPAGMRIWRIRYGSRTLQDTDIGVSGVIVAPDGPAPARGFPLVTVAHGTTGINQKCAVSLDPIHTGSASPTAVFPFMIEPLVRAGYVVAASDYQGLGTPGPVSYLIGTVEGRNVLDAARAARRFAQLRISEGTLIWGHSQGGHAAAFAAAMAAVYAPEVKITGAVIGSPAVELKRSVAGIQELREPSPVGAYSLLIAAAWTEAYPGLRAETILTGRGIKALSVVRGGCVPDVLASLATEPPSIFFKADPARITRWAEFLDRNTPRAERVHFPLFVFQGESDTVVNPEFTDAFVARLCRSGNAVLYKKYPGEDHVGAINAARTDFLDWMRDRLIGKSPEANCGAPR